MKFYKVETKRSRERQQLFENLTARVRLFVLNLTGTRPDFAARKLFAPGGYTPAFR